jgi:hypothetical protein
MSPLISKKYAVLILLNSAFLLCNNAHGATATASAGIFGIDGGALLNFSNDQYVIDVSTPLQSNSYAGTTLHNYYLNNTPSFASVDDSLSPTPQTSAGATGNGRGSATVRWSFDWLATGTGIALFEVEYLYSATLADLLSGETGTASASISAELDGTATKQEVLYFFNGQNGNIFGDEYLTMSFDVVAGQKGTITLSVASHAMVAPPVPIPPAAWLMGSALSGLCAIAKRRREQQRD